MAPKNIFWLHHRDYKVTISNPTNFDIFPIIITLILKTRLRRVETLDIFLLWHSNSVINDSTRFSIDDLTFDRLLLVVFFVTWCPNPNGSTDEQFLSNNSFLQCEHFECSTSFLLFPHPMKNWKFESYQKSCSKNLLSYEIWKYHWRDDNFDGLLCALQTRLKFEIFTRSIFDQEKCLKGFILSRRTSNLDQNCRF